jgi:hypothetical protein
MVEDSRKTPWLSLGRSWFKRFRGRERPESIRERARAVSSSP